MWKNRIACCVYKRGELWGRKLKTNHIWLLRRKRKRKFSCQVRATSLRKYHSIQSEIFKILPESLISQTAHTKQIRVSQLQARKDFSVKHLHKKFTSLTKNLRQQMTNNQINWMRIRGRSKSTIRWKCTSIRLKNLLKMKRWMVVLSRTMNGSSTIKLQSTVAVTKFRSRNYSRFT